MKRDWSSDLIFRLPAEFHPSERQYKFTVTDPDIRMAVLGIDGRIRPCTKNYSGPPGIILHVSPVAVDDDGRPPRQFIRMLNPAWIRLIVPPLQGWRDKYVILPEKLGGVERAQQEGFAEPSEHSLLLRPIYYTVEPREDVPV